MTASKPLPPPLADGLRARMSRLNFWCYFTELHVLADAGEVVHLGTPHQFIADTLTAYWMPVLQVLIGGYYSADVQLHVDRALPCNCTDDAKVGVGYLN